VSPVSTQLLKFLKSITNAALKQPIGALGILNVVFVVLLVVMAGIASLEELLFRMYSAVVSVLATCIGRQIVGGVPEGASTIQVLALLALFCLLCMLIVRTREKV